MCVFATLSSCGTCFWYQSRCEPEKREATVQIRTFRTEFQGCYLTLLLCDKGEIGKKNFFRSFPLSIPFLSKVLPDVSLTICLVTTWPKCYICLTTCTSTIDPSLTRLYSTLTRSTSSSFADTYTSNEAFSLSWNTTSPWNVQRWHLKCALE